MVVREILIIKKKKKNYQREIYQNLNNETNVKQFKQAYKI